jgi:hypothetical protein
MEIVQCEILTLRRRTQVAKGEVCKTFIQRFESARRLIAQVVKLVDTRDLKSLGLSCPCRFDSGPGQIAVARERLL